MNWLLKSLALTLLFSAVAVLPKVYFSRGPSAFSPESQDKALLLRNYIARQSPGSALTAASVRGTPYWTGWTFRAGSCSATAWPDIEPDEHRAIERLADPGQSLAYFKNGNLFSEYPSVRITIEKGWNRLVLPFRSTQWRTPLLIILSYSGDCRDALRWNWRI